jgi:hypothetical protein
LLSCREIWRHSRMKAGNSSAVPSWTRVAFGTSSACASRLRAEPLKGAAGQAPYTIRVVGDDFNKRGAVTLRFDEREEFYVQPDDIGLFARTIETARRPAGTYVIRAFHFPGRNRQRRRRPSPFLARSIRQIRPSSIPPLKPCSIRFRLPLNASCSTSCRV